jgi:hypothetical protein
MSLPSSFPRNQAGQYVISISDYLIGGLTQAIIKVDITWSNLEDGITRGIAIVKARIPECQAGIRKDEKPLVVGILAAAGMSCSHLWPYAELSCRYYNIHYLLVLSYSFNSSRFRTASSSFSHFH